KSEAELASNNTNGTVDKRKSNKKKRRSWNVFATLRRNDKVASRHRRTVSDESCIPSARGEGRAHTDTEQEQNVSPSISQRAGLIRTAWRKSMQLFASIGDDNLSQNNSSS